MDGARRAKFAVDIRVPTLEAVFAHIDVMLHANIAGWSVGVVGTGFQIHTSFFAKAFEIIADLSNWELLKPFRIDFVNIFIILRAVSLKNRK